jgi:hypothetical protein
VENTSREHIKKRNKKSEKFGRKKEEEDKGKIQFLTVK